MTQPLIRRAQRIRWLRAWILETDKLQGSHPSRVTLEHSPHFSKPWLPPLWGAVAVPGLRLCGITWDDAPCKWEVGGVIIISPKLATLPCMLVPPTLPAFFLAHTLAHSLWTSPVLWPATTPPCCQCCPVCCRRLFATSQRAGSWNLEFEF